MKNKKENYFIVTALLLMLWGASLNPLFSQDRGALSQIIRGRVVDKETQAPLPGANIIVLNTSPLKGAMSDAEGYFRIQNVQLGRVDIQVTYMGYKLYPIRGLQLTASKEIVLKIEMEEDAFLLESVVVNADKDNKVKFGTTNSMTTLSARTFSAEETQRYAGGMDDPARMASAFAGVAVGNIQDNSIIIRGNSPKGVLWRLEGAEIPNPSHFAGANVAGGGFTTLFSRHLLANSDFFTGAFPAEYGNALAGVFDIKLRNGNNEQSEYAAQAGVMGIDFSAEGPLREGHKASYLVNYRYSTFGLIKQFIPSEQIPEYQDLSFKLNFPTNKGGVLSFWGIGGNDKNSEPVTDDTTQWLYNWDRVQYDLSTNMAASGLSYKKILDKSSFFHSSLSFSTYTFSMDMQRMNDDLVLRDTLFIDDTESKLSFSGFYNKKFSKAHSNRTGLILDKLYYNTHTKGVYEGTMIDFINSRGESSMFRIYSQSKVDLSKNVLMNIGVHGYYFLLNEKAGIEPRLGLKYTINSKNTLSMAYGNHSQPEPLKVYLYQKDSNGQQEFPNQDLGFSKAHHTVLGYDHVISNNLRLKIEPYFQSLYNVPVIADSTWSMINYEQENTFDKELINEGKGQNIGIDFTLERFLHNSWYYLATASFFNSTYTAGNAEKYNSRFNKNYVITILGGKEFVFNQRPGKKNILGLNARLSAMGGHRILPVDEEQSLRGKSIIFDWTHPFEKQNPGDFFLDLTLSYRINKRTHSSIWTLQIKNLTGTPSNYMYQYNIKEHEIEFTDMKVIVPSLSYKIEF